MVRGGGDGGRGRASQLQTVLPPEYWQPAQKAVQPSLAFYSGHIPTKFAEFGGFGSFLRWKFKVPDLEICGKARENFFPGRKNILVDILALRTEL